MNLLNQKRIKVAAILGSRDQETVNHHTTLKSNILLHHGVGLQPQGSEGASS